MKSKKSWSKSKKKFFIGTSGWNYEHWLKRFYPKKLPQKQWLEFYSKYFNTVEINMTFYRWPKSSFFASWYKRTPKGFKFTIKATRLITHIKKLKNVGKLVKDFYKLVDRLKEKLACILWQLPPNFKPTEANIQRLEKFLKFLNKKYRNVIEFRHESWWQEKIYRLLRKHNVCFCIVSGIGMPEKIVVTSKIAYFRFHEGKNSGCYSASQLRDYSNKMKKIKVSEVYAYFNNDSSAYAVKNAIQLKKLQNN